MNFLSNISLRKLLGNSWMIISGLALATLLTSCEKFYFDEGDCDPHYFVEYIYDMNMEWADAFPSQVNSVELLVFNPESGELVARFSENDRAALSAPGYRMPIDLKPGTYDFVAWCGLSNNKKDLFYLPSTITNREQANCTLSRNYDGETAYQDNQLNPVFHGRIIANLPDEQGVHVVQVKLTKDTNNINISMQHVMGDPLSSKMFTITMSDGNGHLAYDNSLLPDGGIEYRPWSIRDGNSDVENNPDDSDNLNFFIAELSTSRLMADRDTRINIIENETGKTVYSIPFIKWATTFRSEQYSDANNDLRTIADNQEYLDRQSDYNIMLYLDNKDGWSVAAIFINSWRVVEQGADVDSSNNSN